LLESVRLFLLDATQLDSEAELAVVHTCTNTRTFFFLNYLQQIAKSYMETALLFMFGLGAGISLIQLYIIGKRTNDTDLLTFYTKFTSGMRFTLFFLTMIAWTATLTRSLSEIYMFPSSWAQRSRSSQYLIYFWNLVVFVAVVSTLSAVETDDRMRFSGFSTSDLANWYNYVAARFFGLFFGFLIMAVEMTAGQRKRGLSGSISAVDETLPALG